MPAAAAAKRGCAKQAGAALRKQAGAASPPLSTAPAALGGSRKRVVKGKNQQVNQVDQEEGQRALDQQERPEAPQT